MIGAQIDAALEAVRPEGIVEVRDDAREETACAAAAIASEIAEALGGGLLAGLINLAPWATSPYPAARVGGRPPFGIDEFLPRDARPALVVNRRGELARVAVGARGGIEERPVSPRDVRVEELEPYARAVLDALRRHVVRQARTAEGYGAARAFAIRLAEALENT